MPHKGNLLAANNTQIKLDGEAELQFYVGHRPFSAMVSVTDAIDELIFGIDWIASRGCSWNFETGQLLLNGEWVKLQQRPARDRVRRIYAADDVEIPAMTQTEIPVDVAWKNLRVEQEAWMVEPAALKDGVIAARTLVGGDALHSTVRVINLNDRAFRVHKDDPLGEAHQVGDSNIIPVADARLGPGSMAVTTPNHDDVETCSEGLGVGSHLPEHMQCLIDTLPPDLTDVQRDEVERFLALNADVFSRSEFDLGCTSLLQHSIETRGKGPVRQGLRRHPMAYLPKIDEYVENMLENGIIRPMPGSEWVSNVVLVRKKDGTLRYCVDYRGLNAVTQKANYPLPRIDTCLESLGENRLFSSLDMRSSYWQVKVREEDVEKTCFIKLHSV